jgi:endonuclease-8
MSALVTAVIRRDPTLPDMPEGDTIWRVADRLRPALVGHRLVRFEAARLSGGPRPRPGDLIESVEAQGKHLLIRFERGVTLQTHLRMTGAWHLYRRGERWRKPVHLARAVIEADSGWVAVCFAAPVVRTFVDAPGSGPGPTAHLGPDLCQPQIDLDAVVERVATLSEPDELICDVLLDQRVAAGIGNVYKSEVLWACRVDPRTPVAEVTVEDRRLLYTAAHRLLRANLGDGPRVTYPGAPGGVAVYGRRGRPCPRCGTSIQRQLLGHLARSTYWCPRCQPGAGSRDQQ